MSASVSGALAHKAAEVPVAGIHPSLRPVASNKSLNQDDNDLSAVDLRSKAEFCRFALVSRVVVEPKELGPCCYELKRAISEYIANPDGGECVTRVRVAAGSTAYCLRSWLILIEDTVRSRSADSLILRDVMSPVADSGARLFEIEDQIGRRSQLNGSFERLSRVLEDFNNRLIPLLERVPGRFQEARAARCPTLA